MNTIYLVTVGNSWGKSVSVEEAVDNAMSAYGRPQDHLTKMNVKEFKCEKDKLVMNGLGFEYPEGCKIRDEDVEITEAMRKAWDKVYDLKVDIDEQMFAMLDPVYEVIY